MRSIARPQKAKELRMSKEYKNPKAKVIMTPREFLKRNCGDHPWWDSITDDQLDAVMEKYKFNKEDLDDLTNARVIICELAHGPPPFSEDACYCVEVMCEGDLCINPAHLEWVELSPNSTH
jgi:hypothetical protein